MMVVAVAQYTPDRNARRLRDEASPAFEGRFAGLEAINPTLKQRLFGG